MNGGVLSDSQIAAMSAAERAQLIDRLQPRQGESVTPSVTQQIRRLRLWISLAAAIALIPWIVYLALTLPQNYVAHNWRAAWVGFDILLLVFMIATAALGFMHRHLVTVVAFTSGVLLISDA